MFLRRFVGLLLFLAVAVWGLRISSPVSLFALFSPDKTAKVVLTPDETLLFQAINAERSSRGMRPLLIDDLLVRVAREHSEDMCQRGYLAHLAEPPAGRTPADRYARAAGHPPKAVMGENIARSGQPLMGMIHENLMASPEHAANILDKEYNSVGVGIYSLEEGRVWASEVFLGAEPQTR